MDGGTNGGTGEDSGHDSDVSNSPTPPRPSPAHHTTPVSAPGSNKSIFERIFKNHLEDRKRPNFLNNFPTKTVQHCGEPLCKRFK